MLIYPHINKIAFQIGPIKIYWYGVMYLLSFILVWFLAKYKSKQLHYNWSNEQISDLIFYCALGTVLGGRIGYVLIYGLKDLLADPFFLFRIWQGGMSFHGGLIGVTIALYFFAKKMHLRFLTLGDFIAPLIPPCLALGRIGNFINAELPGRITTVPWGMIFPQTGPLPRHPSQLYQAFAEGIILFLLLWFFSAKPRPRGTVSALFLIGYGSIRFVCEFFREPDSQLGSVAFNWLTMGQLLSLPMIIIGIIMMVYYEKNKENVVA